MEVTDMWGSAATARHGFWMPRVTDFGCRSCGLWRHGLVMGMVVLGWEMQGFWASDVAPIERVLGWGIKGGGPVPYAFGNIARDLRR